MLLLSAALIGGSLSKGITDAEAGPIGNITLFYPPAPLAGQPPPPPFSKNGVLKVAPGKFPGDRIDWYRAELDLYASAWAQPPNRTDIEHRKWSSTWQAGGPPGGTGQRQVNATMVGPWSNAEAEASGSATGAAGAGFDVLNYQLKLAGFASVTKPPPPVPGNAASSNAKASARFSYGGRGVHGGQWSGSVSAGAHLDKAGVWPHADKPGRVARLLDPLTYEVHNLATGTSASGTLYSMEFSMFSPGDFLWDGGVLDFAAPDYDFLFDISSPYTVQQGSIEFRVRDGLVTTSVGTGDFTGLLPAVGESGIFSMSFDIPTIDFDFGALLGPSDPFEIGFAMSAEGFAFLAAPDHCGSALLWVLLLAALEFRWRRRATADSQSIA